MAKKKKFLVNKKQMGKSVGDAFVKTGVTSVGFLGAKGGTNLLKNKIPEKFQKLTGPVKFLVGTVLDGITDKAAPAAKFVKPLGVGIAVSGAEDMVMEFVPDDIRGKIGLSGISISGPADEFDLDKELEKMATAAETAAEQEEQVHANEQPADDGMSGTKSAEEYKDMESDLL